MSNSNTSSKTSTEKSKRYACLKIVLEIFFIKSTSEFQTSVAFFISERKHKVWVVIFLVRSYRTFWY